MNFVKVNKKKILSINFKKTLYKSNEHITKMQKILLIYYSVG